MIVLDASLVGPLTMPDEANDLPAATIAELLAADFRVPSHWRLEVANMFRTAVRRRRITPQQRDAGMELIAMLAVEVDARSWDAAWSAVPLLADRHDLTSYDAAYLELARRLGATLGTLDNALRRAAVAEGISVLEITT